LRKEERYEQGVNIWLRTGCDLRKVDGEATAFAQYAGPGLTAYATLKMNMGEKKRQTIDEQA